MAKTEHEARCMKCRKNVGVNEAEVEAFEVKGRERFRLIGKCEECDGRVFKFMSAEAGKAAVTDKATVAPAKATPTNKKAPAATIPLK